MSKIFVRLRDGGSTFLDESTGQNFSGLKVYEVEKEPSIARAIQAGRMVQLESAEGSAAVERQNKIDEIVLGAEQRAADNKQVFVALTDSEQAKIDKIKNPVEGEAVSQEVIPEEKIPEPATRPAARK